MVSGQCHQCAVGFNTRLESDHDGLDFARRICMATCSVVVVLVGVPSACLWDYCRVAALHMFVQRRQLFVQVCLECCPPESDNYPTQVSCFTACSATSSCVISSATVSTSSWCFSRGESCVTRIAGSSSPESCTYIRKNSLKCSGCKGALVDIVLPRRFRCMMISIDEMNSLSLST